MAADLVCQHFKYGHCKYSDICRYRHINTICVKEDCDIASCSERHPKVCKFYQDYGRCKFNPCSYKHSRTKNQFEFESKIEILEEKIKNLEKVLDDKSKDIEVLDKTILKQNEMISKYDDKLSELKDEILESLEIKVRTVIENSTPPLEKILGAINQTLVQTISNALVPFRHRQEKIEIESQHNFKILDNQLSELLGCIRPSQTRSLKCDQCGQSFELESKLQSHRRTCHKQD